MCRARAASGFIARPSYARLAFRAGATLRHAHAHPQEPPRRLVVALPPPARGEPRRLAPVGPRGAGEGEAGGQADPPLDRLRGLPLVPRHGARELRGRGDRGADERALRQRQGRPGGAARSRPDLPARHPDHGAQRRLAAHGLPHAGPATVLRGHVLPSGGQARHARLLQAAARARGRVPHPARRSGRASAGDHPGDRAGGPGAEGGRSDRRRRAAARVPAAHRALRRPERRLRRPAQVPQHDGARRPAPPRRARGRSRLPGERRARARAHARRRNLGRAPRRVSSLLDRRALARPPFREDALRQRPAPAPLRRRLPRVRRRGPRGDGARDRRLPLRRDARRRARGRVLRVPGRGLGGARGAVLRLHARRREEGRGRSGPLRRRAAALRRHGGGELRGDGRDGALRGAVDRAASRRRWTSRSIGRGLRSRRRSGGCS